MLAGRREGGAEQVGAGQGPGAVVDRDHVQRRRPRSPARSAWSAFHSEACRVSPPSTRPISASPRCGARAAATSSCSPGRTTTRTRRTSSRLTRVAHRPGQHGDAGERQQHLVGAGADARAGARGEDHDGGGHARSLRSPRRRVFSRLLHDETAGQHRGPRFVGPRKGRHVTSSSARSTEEWQPVCRVVELEVERGATALVHGQAIAIFRTQDDRCTRWATTTRSPRRR